MNETPPEFMSLPGFRFHPTEEELLDFYLRKMVFGEKLPFNVIGLLNIYHYEPWELPEMAKNGEREWYFYVIRERKQGNGGRPSRTTEHGFWKATGSDRPIRSISHPKRLIGLRKTLVFYKGRAQRGSCKTEWIMNEYRMPPSCSLPKNDMVLCKIYRKATPLRILEQKAAMEEKMRTQEAYSSSQTMNSTSLPYQQQDNLGMPISAHDNVFVFKAEVEEEEAERKEEREDEEANSSLRGDFVKESLPELQVPNFSLDWTQDPLWTQLCSPWLDIWTPYMNALNS